LLEANESLARQAAQAAKKELNNKQAKFQEEEIKLKEQANRANKLRNQAQAERKKIRENKNAEITQIRKQLNNAGKLSEEEKAQLRKNLEKAKTEKEKELANLKQKMEEQQELQKKITEKTQKLSNKRQATIATLKTNLQTATKNLTNTKQSLIKTEGWLKTKTNKLARAEGLITTQKASINASKTNLNERQKQVGKLYRNIEAKNAALAQKNKEAAEALAQKNREAAEALTQKNREAAEALTQKNKDVNTMTQTIAARNVQLREALTKVRNANDRHETNKAAFAALQTESANLQKNLTAARELFERTQKEQTTLRWKKAIGNKVSSKKINKLTNYKNKLINNTKRLGKEIQNGKKVLTATQRTLKEKSDQVEFGQKQLGNAQVDIQGLTQNKTNLTKNKTNLKTRLVGTKWKGIVGNRKLNQTRGQLQTAQNAATLNQQRAQAKINATKGQLRTTQGRLEGVQGQLRNVQKTLPGLKNSKYREKLYGMVDTEVNGKLVVRNSRWADIGVTRRAYKNEIMDPKTTYNDLKKIESKIQSHIKAATFTFGENELPGVSFATGGTQQQRNSRTPATNGKTPTQAVRRSTSSIGSRVVNRHQRQRQRQQ
jgi:chromosome segregation ATPase